MEPTKHELYEEAKRLDIEGRSGMDKDELRDAVAEAGDGPPAVFPTGRWLHDHLLGVVLVGLFLLSLIGQFYYQYQEVAQNAIEHGQSAPAMWSAEYLNVFLAAVFENWQSEFLQLLAMVVLTTYFIFRGSAESRDSQDELGAEIKAIREELRAR